MIQANSDDSDQPYPQQVVSSFEGKNPPQTESTSHSNAKDTSGVTTLQINKASAHHSTNASAQHSHAATHSMPHNSDSTAGHHYLNSPSGVFTCPVHRDLPLPGTDIMPAEKGRCYHHPPEYRNNNYLNDSFYMLYHHDIPTSDLHPAFSWGDLGRFAHISHKMRRNEPVTVTFVGGSVSSSYCKNPSVTCWVAPVSDWLTQQNSEVKIINNAIGGTTSRTTAECFDAMVGKDADLVFLEYSYNDRYSTQCMPVSLCHAWPAKNASVKTMRIASMTKCECIFESSAIIATHRCLLWSACHMHFACA